LVGWLGSKTSHLQKMVIRILSLTCSASSYEHNWSTFEQVHTKKRNRLEQKKLNDLVFVQYNQRLQDRYLQFQKADLDPIMLDDIDDCNEWIAYPQDEQDLVKRCRSYMGKTVDRSEEVDSKETSEDEHEELPIQDDSDSYNSDEKN
ncbi:hypothetical protein Taro_010834, partial [Colocasia esculenta]|nr:hypothetical protein [Colocasia esculenta]